MEGEREEKEAKWEKGKDRKDGEEKGGWKSKKGNRKRGVARRWTTPLYESSLR